MQTGIRITDMPNINLADALLAIGDGTSGPITAQDLAIQLAASGALAEALTTLQGQITQGLRLVEGFADLQALVGTVDGEGAEVPDSDTGTHSLATATGYDGATVNNAGRFSWVPAWSRWLRIGDTGLSGRVSNAAFAAHENASNPHGTSADDIDETAARKFLTATERSKVSYLAITAATDLDAMRTKAGHLSVTAATDLDAMRQKLASLTFTGSVDLGTVKTRVDALDVEIHVFEDGRVVVDRAEGKVHFPRLRVRRFGLPVQDCDAVSLDLPSGNTNNLTYIIDLSEPQASRIQQVTAGTAKDTGSVFVIGTAGYNAVSILRGLPREDKDAQDRIAAIEALPRTVPDELRYAMWNMQFDALEIVEDVFVMHDQPAYFEWAPASDKQKLIVPANRTAALSYHAEGRMARLFGKNTFRIFAGLGQTFEDEGTANIATITGGGEVVAASRGGKITLITSGTVTYSTEAEPVPDYVFVLTEQSHNVITAASGIGGFLMALGDTSLPSYVNGHVAILECAVGSTGALAPEGACFWDAASNGPTPLLLAEMQKINDRVTNDGWPRPIAFWANGDDADRAAFDLTNPNTGQPFTQAEIETTKETINLWIRDNYAPGAQIFATPYGAALETDPDSGKTSDAVCTAIRFARIRAHQAQFAHMLADKSNMPRELGDVHGTQRGYYAYGYNAGLHIGTKLNGGDPESLFHVRVTDVSFDDQWSFRVTLAAPAGTNLIFPRATHPGNLIIDPFPAGFGLVGSSQDAINDMIPLKGCELLPETNQIRFFVEENSALDVRGAWLITTAGRRQRAYLGRFPRHDMRTFTQGSGVLPSVHQITTQTPG